MPDYAAQLQWFRERERFIEELEEARRAPLRAMLPTAEEVQTLFGHDFLNAPSEERMALVANKIAVLESLGIADPQQWCREGITRAEEERRAR